MTRGLFITSPGTELGKTFIAAALVHQMREAGRPVSVLKPVISDFDPAAPEGTDTGILLRALGQPIDLPGLDAVSPWRYRAALAPNMAAAREGESLDYAAIRRFCDERLGQAGAEELVLVEGAGGVMAPLTDDVLMIDWMADLGLPALVVAGGYLGTISHTLSALSVLQARGIAITGLVLTDNGAAPLPAPLGETADVIARFVPSLPILTVPFQNGDDAWRHVTDLKGFVINRTVGPGR